MSHSIEAFAWVLLETVARYQVLGVRLHAGAEQHDRQSAQDAASVHMNALTQ